jgi:putative ABC transport system permease protein
MALGALPQQVLAYFLGLGTRLLLAGLAVGTLGTWFLGRAAASILFEVKASDPLVLAASVGVLSLVILVAVVVPARRASRVSPLEALHE